MFRFSVESLVYVEIRFPCRLQNSRFRSFRKARSAVSVILECESREPSSSVNRANLTRPSLPHSPLPFLHSLQTFRSNMDAPSLTVARVRKKYDCFAVYFPCFCGFSNAGSPFTSSSSPRLSFCDKSSWPGYLAQSCKQNGGCTCSLKCNGCAFLLYFVGNIL